MQKDKSINTYKANVELGFKEDYRDYTDAKKIIDYLSINDFVLLTANKDKINAISGLKFEVINQIGGENEINMEYLSAKKNVNSFLVY
jgi:GTP cyclohydrolase II